MVGLFLFLPIWMALLVPMVRNVAVAVTETTDHETGRWTPAHCETHQDVSDAVVLTGYSFPHQPFVTASLEPW